MYSEFRLVSCIDLFFDVIDGQFRCKINRTSSKPDTWKGLRTFPMTGILEQLFLSSCKLLEVLEGLKEDWFLPIGSPSSNKELTYLLTYLLTQVGISQEKEDG